MARERYAANAAPNIGLLGFRYPDEPSDGRPVVVMGTPFENASAQLHYEYAVESHPRQRSESHLKYIIRIAELVAARKLAPIAKTWPPPKPHEHPEARLPYRDSDGE